MVIFYGKHLPYRPLINYACSAPSYSASDYKKLENLQFLMARTILKAPRNTPSVTLLGDLGWETIENLHKQCKVRYFDQLINMNSHRWPKLLFNAILTTYNSSRHLRWNWINGIEMSLIDCGYDHVFRSVYNHNYNPHWVNSFQHKNRNHCNINWYNTACNKSSLYNYVYFKKTALFRMFSSR